jgi:diacylglycerol O-acyltransferase
MSLDKIKTVGRAISTATLNDVLIATVTGAMRRYLKSRNTRVNELNLRVTVPVNIRKPGTEFELGNKFSLVFLPLPVHLEDPILRLKESKDEWIGSKPHRTPYQFCAAQRDGVFAAGFGQKSGGLFRQQGLGVLTNVPGPRQPLYFAGQKIKNFMFWVPRSGQIGSGSASSVMMGK